MAHTLDLNKIGQVLQSCMEYSEHLNQWEQDFIAAMDDRHTRGLPFSEAMLEKIEQVYLKCP